MYESTSMNLCPFYRRQRKSGSGTIFLYCENLRVSFESKESRRRYVCGYCTNGGYRKGVECTWHAEMMRRYDKQNKT